MGTLTENYKTIKNALTGISTSLNNKLDSGGEVSSLSEVAEKIRMIETKKSATFGVKILTKTSDPEARVTYIDDAVDKTPVKVDQSSGKANYNGWDETWIFDKVYPVMLKSDGTIDYKLDPNDVTQKLGGGASDVGNINYDGNAMVCYEKFYTKYSMDGEDNVIEISDEKQDGFEAIGFIREDGSEADKVYLPMFGGNRDSSGKLRSISGQPITYNISWNDSRTAAQKNGSGYDIETWAMNQMRNALWYVLMKNCNPKTAIADGRGYTSAQTGVTNKVGAIGFDTSSKAVKFLWSEDFTSNYSNGMYFWEAGILCQSSKIFVKMKPPYSGTSTSGYTQVSDYVHGQNYMSAMKCHNDFGRYGTAYTGSNSTYEAAYWYTNTVSSIYISRRGSYFGVAGRSLPCAATYPNAVIGASLSFLPPA